MTEIKTASGCDKCR